MLNTKAAEDGYVALKAFDSVYMDYINAVSDETDQAYGKCYRNLRQVRRLAGKLGDILKRTGRPSRFLEAALIAYDYADALAMQASSQEEVDQQARVCAAAMAVVKEAVQYEFRDGIFASYDKPADFANFRELATLN
jgi:hypothetical protein